MCPSGTLGPAAGDFKIIIIFTIIFTWNHSKIASSLNSDSAQIKRQILSQGGRLRISALEDGQEFPGYYHILIFKFSESSIRKNGIHLTTFFLTTKNKCFAYTVSYADTSYIAKLKNTFNQTNSGMKQVGNRLMWINPVKKYIVKVLPNIPVNGKIAPVFDLEIKNE